MKYIRNISISLMFILTACGEEKPTKYSFDVDELKANKSKYTLSKGTESEFGCMISALILTKEVLASIKDGKKPQMQDLKNITPAVINVYEKKISWLDLEQETPINDRQIELKGPGGSLKFTIIRENGILMLGFKEKEIECNFPFKKLSE